MSYPQVLIVGLAGEAGSGKSSVAAALGKMGFHRLAFAGPLRELCQRSFCWRRFDPDKDKLDWYGQWHEPFTDGLDPAVSGWFTERKGEVLDPPLHLPLDAAQHVANQMGHWIKGHTGLDIETDGPWQAFVDLLTGHTFTTPREILQFVGTDLVRAHLGSEFWLKRAGATLEAMYERHRAVGQGTEDPPMLVVFDDLRFANEREFLRKWADDWLGESVLLRLKCPNPSVAVSDGGHASEHGLGDDFEYDEVLEFDHGELRSLRQTAIDAVTDRAMLLAEAGNRRSDECGVMSDESRRGGEVAEGLQACGHPLSAISSSDEGTNCCLECVREAG